MSLEVSEKRSGQVFTPETLAGALCRWAIRSASDVVIDLGVGEGTFALRALERLLSLGQDETSAAAQIYGAERDPELYGRAQAAARSRLGGSLPNVVCADFYDTSLPSADAVVGNPPYIRRHYQQEPARIRRASGAAHAAGLTDYYCYFLFRACKALKPRGRLGVIVSASWLDMKYGEALKQLLLEEFRLRLLLAFEGRVFPNALIKPLVILAEKTSGDGPVSFARLSHRAPLDSLELALEDLAAGSLSNNATVAQVAQSELAPTLPWTAFLKAPQVHASLGRQTPLTLLRDVAESRIGLQTFAKGFYVMTRAEAEVWGIEADYILPLVFSPKEVRSPVISDKQVIRHVVFACDRTEAELRGTAAWRYITHGMGVVVPVRGKDHTVQGFHQAPRLARSRRRPWYNLRTSIEKRGAFPILLPRRVFESYLVIHNRAGVVANEDFIELRPLNGEAGVEPLLAFLNSSVGEFLVRSHSFQYGGGVFNLNPGAARDVPVVDPAELFRPDANRLAHAWNAFVSDYGSPGARSELDRQVEEVLGLSPELRLQVAEALRMLVRLARNANKRHRAVEPGHVDFR